MNIKIKFSNNASARLEVPVDRKSTTITIPKNKMGLFPAITSGEYFMLTLIDGNGNYEIVKCTYKSLTSFTVVRAQEGTTAKNFPVNSLVEHRLTAGSIAQLFTQVVASTTEYGLVRIATDAEIRNGVTAGNPPAVVTPEGLKKAISTNVVKATTTKHGIARQATESEQIAGVTSGNAPAFCTPEGMKKAINTAVSGALSSIINRLNKIESDIKNIKVDVNKIKGDITKINSTISSAISNAVPIGTIVPYHGTFSGVYPVLGGKTNTSWRICDGGGGTPNLVNRFIKGSNAAGANKTGGQTDTSKNISTGKTVLTIANLPSHSHSYNARALPNKSNTAITHGELAYGDTSSAFTLARSFSTGSGTSHSHSIKIENILPAYYTLAYIKKIK